MNQKELVAAASRPETVDSIVDVWSSTRASGYLGSDKNTSVTQYNHDWLGSSLKANHGTRELFAKAYADVNSGHKVDITSSVRSSVPSVSGAVNSLESNYIRPKVTSQGTHSFSFTLTRLLTHSPTHKIWIMWRKWCKHTPIIIMVKIVQLILKWMKYY